MTGSDFEAKLAEIKRAYQAELPNKVSDLKAVWNGVEAEHWGADRLQELHRLVHSLTGSGATFGFEDLSYRARALEIELKALLHKDAEDIPATRARIPALLNALIEVVHAASSERAKPKAEPPSDATDTVDNRPLYLLGKPRPEVLDLVEQLGYYGYAVDQFTSVESLATGLAVQAPAGIVVAQDPDQTALDLLRPLALEAEIDERIPVVFVADRFSLDVRLAAVRAGCGAYFTWPVDAGVVASRLNQLTHRQVSEPIAS